MGERGESRLLPYDRQLVETRYQQMGSQALALTD